MTSQSSNHFNFYFFILVLARPRTSLSKQSVFCWAAGPVNDYSNVRNTLKLKRIGTTPGFASRFFMFKLDIPVGGNPLSSAIIIP
jgi:hypothetical protein